MGHVGKLPTGVTGPKGARGAQGPPVSEAPTPTVAGPGGGHWLGEGGSFSHTHPGLTGKALPQRLHPTSFLLTHFCPHSSHPGGREDAPNV